MFFFCVKNSHWPDPGIADQMIGRSEDFLVGLSSIFVQVGSYYGTRTHSIILIDSQDRAYFYERTMASVPNGSDVEWIETRHEFDMEPPSEAIKLKNNL